MSSVPSRVLGIQPNERTFVVGCVVLAMHAMAGSVLVLATVTALFLGAADRSQLPLVYAAGALIGGACTVVLGSLQGKISRAREISGTFLVLAAALALGFVLLPWWPRALLFALHPIATSLAMLSIVQTYALISDCLDAEQAKRLLPTIGAGGTLGAMAAGAALASLAPALGARAMLLLAAAIAVSAGSLVRKFIALHGDRLQSMRPRSQSMRPDSYAPGASGRQIVQEILRSTLLRRFALVQVATAFASTLLKFELESTLQTTLGIDHIAAFLGMLNLCANGAVLAVQTLLESRLLRAFGLTLGLALAGAILALGGSVLLFASGLWIVAMLRFAEIVARFSVTRTAEDLVLLPVPSEQRRRARAFITTLVMPSSVLLSSLFIALLAHAPSLARNLFMLASGATAAGLGLALRKPYRERLRDSLKRRRITLDPLGKSVHDQTLAALLASLPGAEPSLRLGVLRTLARHRLEGAEIALGGVNVVREIEIEMQHAQRLRWLRHALPRAKLDPRHEHAALREVEHQHERAYEAIFLMLMLLHSPADLQRAYLSIVRGERRERAFAIEMLGHTVPPPLGKQLVSFLSAARSADELIQAQRALGASRDLSLRSAFGEPIPERLRKLALYLSVASPRPEEEPLMAGLQNVFALRSVELFSRLSPEELQSVADIASHHQVPESHVLFREGEPGTSFYVVLRGQLRVERDGKLVAELKDGECFGELALLDKGLRSATVTSITACDLLRIVDEDFRELLERYPSIAIHMLAILARRTTDLLQRS